VDFDGERYVPGIPGLEELFVEHMSRYFFASGLARGRRVLDLGCGCGYGTHFLATTGAGMTIGIDRAAEAVDFARRHYRRPNLDFTVMDACSLGFRPGFDLITCFELIEHVQDASGLLAEARRVLTDQGIFLVSTPNKLTYVAGGEGGTNPFHVREYHRVEFEELLQAAFPHVQVVGQYWTEGILLGLDAPGPGARRVRAGILPGEDGKTPDVLAGKEPPFFMGICARQALPEDALRGIVPLVVHGLQSRFERLKQTMAGLQNEFDERGAWAKRLEQDIRERDDRIRRLQDELAQLRKDFDDRGQWAKGLDREIETSRALVDRLTGENARLKEKLKVREPAGLGRRNG
jgi:SAM-dependent methyltransferase